MICSPLQVRNKNLASSYSELNKICCEKYVAGVSPLSLSTDLLLLFIVQGLSQKYPAM